MIHLVGLLAISAASAEDNSIFDVLNGKNHNEETISVNENTVNKTVKIKISYFSMELLKTYYFLKFLNNF